MNHRKPPRHGSRFTRLACSLTMVLGIATTNANAAEPSPKQTAKANSTQANGNVRPPRESVSVERVTWRVADPTPKNKAFSTDEGQVHRGASQVQHSEIVNGDWHEEPTVVHESPHHETHGSCDCDACCGESVCIPEKSGPVGFWVRGEYVAWSLDAMDLPPLVTTSPGNTTPQNTGVLGGAGQVLFGDDSINDSFRSGGRVTFGWFENESRAVGYEASYLALASDGDDFSTTSAETPRIARPIFDTGLNAESSQLIAHPDFLSGSISVQTDSDLQFIDLIRRQRYSWSRCHQFDLLVGYRHGRLDESIRIEQSSRYTAPQGQILSGTTVDAFDLFSTENRFHGAQFGFDYQQTNGCWTLAGMAKIGLGLGSARVDIDGETVNTVPNSGSATFEGGLLAQTTNIGSYDQSDFVVIPEVGLRLTNRINRCTELSVGYTFMYWSSVARAAGQIDRNVSQLPPEPASGSERPRFAFETDSFIAHGVQAGLQYRF